jgi:hypothetical protein
MIPKRENEKRSQHGAHESSTKSNVSMVRVRAAQKALSALCESSTMHAPGLGLTTGVGEGLHSGVQQLEALAGGWQGARHVPIVQRKQTLGRGCTSASAMQCNAMQRNAMVGNN